MTELPKTMTAMVLTGHGGLDKLEYHEDWPMPEPGPGEVLIRVGACGMNNTDINTRTAWYSKTVREGTHAEGGADGFDEITEDAGGWGAGLQFPRIQGADVCGHAVAVGEGADGSLIGKRVLVDTWLRDWDDPMNRDKCGYYGSEAEWRVRAVHNGALAKRPRRPQRTCPMRNWRPSPPPTSPRKTCFTAPR